MADLFGGKLSKKQLMDRVGNLEQVGGIRRTVLDDGAGRGVRALEVRTGTGFEFTVYPDRGLDIGQASYKGLPLVWFAQPGVQNPAFYDSQGLGFLRTFFGGLLTTCGLTYLGPPCEDDGEQLGIHGRINHQPAKGLNTFEEWNGNELDLRITGVVEEGRLFGHTLKMTRTIKTRLGTSGLEIIDEIENIGDCVSPFMVLYHCNFGYPLLDKKSEILLPARSSVARDEDAAKGNWNKFDEPKAGFTEQVFFHDLKANKGKKVELALVNTACDNGSGLGVFMRFPKQQLPNFTEWKMLGRGAYVLGLEPGNSHPLKRSVLRAQKQLTLLKPGQKKTVNLEFGVIPDKKAIAEYKKNFRY
jgi:uncharacterized protein DUF4432